MPLRAIYKPEPAARRLGRRALPYIGAVIAWLRPSRNRVWNLFDYHTESVETLARNVASRLHPNQAPLPADSRLLHLEQARNLKNR
jgi:hypothetical protein